MFLFSPLLSLQGVNYFHNLGTVSLEDNMNAKAVGSCRFYVCILTTLFLISNCSGQLVIGFGRCPSVTVQSGFDASRYTGLWYEYERFFNLFELGNICVTATYGDAGGGVISVENAGVARFTLFDIITIMFPVSIEGTAVAPDASEPARLRVSFFTDDADGDPNYLVVDTDYDNYTVVFSCQEIFSLFNLQTAWILTREQGVAPTNIDDLKSDLSGFGIDVSNFRLTEQTSCPTRRRSRRSYLTGVPSQDVKKGINPPQQGIILTH